MTHGVKPPPTTPSAPEGLDAMDEVCVRLDCPQSSLNSVLQDSLGAARMGEFEHTFVFFAFHGDNIYRQPTDVRDFYMVQQSIEYHTGRDDYKLHGTVTKTPMLGDQDAIVCRVFFKEDVVAVAVSLSAGNYKRFEKPSATVTQFVYSGRSCPANSPTSSRDNSSHSGSFYKAKPSVLLCKTPDEWASTDSDKDDGRPDGTETNALGPPRAPPIARRIITPSVSCHGSRESSSHGGSLYASRSRVGSAQESLDLSSLEARLRDIQATDPHDTH